jgi:hypothetical protein
VVLVGVMVIMLIFLLGRKSPTIAMMSYLPDDTQTVYGVSIGQIQRYPLFYKSFASATGLETPTHTDPLSKALGDDFIEQIDSVIWGVGAANRTMVIRTKQEFDTAALTKLGREETIEDVKVYSVSRLHELPGPLGLGFSEGKVFAPTNRILVVTTARIQPATLQKILHGDTSEGSIVSRMGPLGKRIARGSVWLFHLERAASNKAADETLARMYKDDSTKARNPLDPGPLRGWGIRASLGSKSVRFEAVGWCMDSAQATTDLENWNKSEIAKGDEGTPERVWTEFANRNFGDKILVAQILSNFSFSASGELFIVKTEADIARVQPKMADWLSPGVERKP